LFGAPRAISIARRADAIVGPRGERPERLAEALAILESSPARLEHALVLVDLGATLRAAGQRRAAREPLLDGLQLATRCGARVLERRFRRNSPANQRLSDFRIYRGTPTDTAFDPFSPFSEGRKRTARAQSSLHRHLGHGSMET
jgi:hypothetical protein